MATIFGKKPLGETIDANDGVTNSADVIIGNAGKDTIYGLGGNDIIKGGGGADILNGGCGIDTATYEDSGVGVWVSLKVGAGSYGAAEGDTLISIENLYGSNHDDILLGDAGDNKLEGAGGDDIIKGGGGADKLLGGDGDDNLYSDGLMDKLDGGDGIDTAIFADADFGLSVDLSWGAVTPGYHRGLHNRSGQDLSRHELRDCGPGDAEHGDQRRELLLCGSRYEP
jgi:Ca2+-binding RTX toxin-like protein